MRNRIYNLLVNRIPGINRRYHAVHDNSHGVKKILSWLYLLWLNFAYYGLHFHRLGSVPGDDIYETRNVDYQESVRYSRESVSEMADKLMKYDVISFDIFDTLIYRPFSAPADLFYLIGEELNCLDFAGIRAEVERESRLEKYKREKTYEVTLSEIWQLMELRTGIGAEHMETEIRIEKEMCYANPFMLQVYQELVKAGKTICYTSDMYLPGEVLRAILKNSGYGPHPLYLSCEKNLNKAGGELFDYVKKDMSSGTRSGNLTFAHVGDNPVSDVKRAEEHGFSAFPVINPNRDSVLYRAHDLNPVIGGAYRGIVNNRLHCGLEVYSPQYEYGFIYGGLFVLGYCQFIHDCCRSHGVEKILFLARDGQIVERAYRLLYPDEKTAYVYMSRTAGAKLTARHMKYDYIRKFVRHKVNQSYTWTQILDAMELSELLDELPADEKDKKLTSENAEEFISFLNVHWNKVLDIYKPQRETAESYFREAVGSSKRVAAVDIGWAGSGAVALQQLFEKEWHIDCEVTGILAGTNSAHNAEPFMSESQLLNGRLVSYLYSTSFNRDLWKKHDPNKDYNLYWELLTSSKDPSFIGFYPDGLKFAEPEPNGEGIDQIQLGILDFVKDYAAHFEKYPYMYHISGRDAYAPMLAAAGSREKYLKRIYKEFQLKVEVGSSSDYK